MHNCLSRIFPAIHTHVEASHRGVISQDLSSEDAKQVVRIDPFPLDHCKRRLKSVVRVG